MTTATYNGWKNYETWCVNLWLTNEPETDEDLERIANRPLSLYHRAEELKEYVETLGCESGTEPLIGATMFVDWLYPALLRSALDNVDWQAIVQNHQGEEL